MSASSIRRETECPASVVLPQANRTTGASTRGNENHAAVEQAIESKDYSNLSPKLAAFLATCDRIEAEVAFVLNVKTQTVRFVGKKIGRNYGPIGKWEIPGTLDMICFIDGVLHVVDWKTRTRVEEAATNPQIGFAAACGMLFHEQEEANGAFWYLNDDWCDAASFTRLDAAAFFAERVAMFERIYAAADRLANGEALNVHAGPWCEYCPAMSHCPEKTRLALAMVGELEAIRSSVANMSDEQAGRAWEKAQDIEKILCHVQDALKARIQSSPNGLPVEGGQKLVVLKEERMNGYDFDAIKTTFADMGQEVPRKPGVRLMPRKIKAA